KAACPNKLGQVIELFEQRIVELSTTLISRKLFMSIGGNLKRVPRTFQLASNRTTILFPVRAGEIARIGPKEVRERYGVDPHQVPDFIALRGDPSDKIPGALGVGATGAASILRKYGSLESALVDGRFAKQAEELRLFRSIATMDRKAPLPCLRNQAGRPLWREIGNSRNWQSGLKNSLPAENSARGRS
ncbi:MAG: hypothetical protein EHM67_03225, partial [Hyphomicrobiaceae bacterium]